MQIIKQKLAEGDPKYTCFQKDQNDVIWFGRRLVVPVDPEIRKTIFDEAHISKFSIHPGSTKMYQDLKQNFWWSNMKVDIAKYVAECDTCHRMKAIHLKLAGVLQPLSIPMWKWVDISMDFIVGLRGQTHQHRPFHCSSYYLFSAAICRVIHGSNSSFAWNSEDHNL
jgi:hypothetical protein